MAKGMYIGVGSKARKVNKMYVGVGNKARKVKKGYIGVGGVARPFFSGGELAYYGTATPLSAERSYLAAASLPGYAIFAGGSPTTDAVDAYGQNLTKSTPSPLSTAREFLAGTAVGNYAIFAGGSSNQYYAETDAYNLQLTKTTIDDLDMRGSNLCGVSNGSYAIFGPRATSGSMYNSTVDAYSTTLVRTNAPSFNSTGGPVIDYAGASINGYAVFAGGKYVNGNSFYKQLNAYNTSLTRTTPNELSKGRYWLAAVSNGNFLLFGGGRDYSESQHGGDYHDTVDVFTASLAKGTNTTMSYQRIDLTAVYLAPCCLFAGGSGYESAGPMGFTAQMVIDSFDENLLRTTVEAGTSRANLASAAVGAYALFAGGDYVPPNQLISIYVDEVSVFTVD